MIDTYWPRHEIKGATRLHDGFLRLVKHVSCHFTQCSKCA